VSAILPWAAAAGASTVFLATDSAAVVADARAAERDMAARGGGGGSGPRLRFLTVMTNVTRHDGRRISAASRRHLGGISADLGGISADLGGSRRVSGSRHGPRADLRKRGT